MSNPAGGAAESGAHRPYVPASQSLPEITGKAIVPGILLAIPFAVWQSTDVMTIAPDGFETAASWIGAAAAVGFIFWLYRASLRASE